MPRLASRSLDAPERLDRALEVLGLEGRGHLHADTCGALRHDRIAEARHEHALVEQALGERYRLGGLADDDRDDRRVAVERRVPGLDEHLPEDARVLPQAGEQRRIFEHDLDRTESAARDRRRERVREELRAGALREEVADLLRGGDVAAGSPAERLAERAGDHVHLAQQAEVLDRAAAGLPEDADPVRVVDDDHRVVLARELDDVGQLREVSLHREDAVGEDQLPRVGGSGRERVAERRSCPNAGR